MNKGIQLGRGVEFNNSKDSNKFDSFLKITKKFIAFTLAETLIVMGIIGVVAALTIPNLNSSTNGLEQVTKIKKTYAELVQALDRATAVYGPIETWFVNDGNDTEKMNKRFTERLTEFMKLSKNVSCSDDECIFALANGINVVVHYFQTTPYDICSSCDNCKFIGEVGVSSKDFKRIEGADGISFDITNIGIIPAKDSCSRVGIDKLADCSSGIDARYAPTYWILQNGNLDFLKIDEDGKCPNGKELSWSSPSCK